METNITNPGENARPEDFLKSEAKLHSEIAGAAAFPPANWVEKNPQKGFVTFPKRNQQTQSTCTVYALAKSLSIDEQSENGEWRELSPRSIYPYFFIPGGGANSLVEAEASCKQGMTLEYLLPTDGLTEAQAESAEGYAPDAKIIATVYAPQQIIQPATDFETIAAILQTYQALGINKGIMITVMGTNNATWYNLMPTPPNGQPDVTTGLDANGKAVWYHKVVVTDFGLIAGQKYLAIDNSWGTLPGNGGQQFLGENYTPYIYGGMYTLNQPDDWMTSSAAAAIVKPTHTWTTQLEVGSTGPDVLALQQALQSLGMFPVSSVISPTGVFAGITKAGVIEFQVAFALSQTGIVDEPTIAKLNGIFNGSGAAPAAPAA